MHYWNQDNFAGLKAIGERYVACNDWQAFGNYCLMKERGLKQQALAEVQKFIAHVQSLSIVAQRSLADELAALAYANPDVHQLLAYPLQVYLQRVFSAWAQEEHEDPRPHRWLGYLTFDLTLDRSFYQHALALDPNDQISLLALAQSHLGGVEFQTHHLSQSCFLGELADARQSLRDAGSLIARINDAAIGCGLRNSVNYYRRLLDSWQAYLRLNTPLTFSQWCAELGYDFNFGSVVYFKK